mgnify:CR=1 FL=1|tara:strand:+ start:533 stop:1327 length:795 start_codon:yes stop_codon:yes gene_type:complete
MIMPNRPIYADNMRHIRNYENFCPICPHCEKRNYLNRADDLETFRPIAHMVVSCQHEECGKEFHINADLVNSKHEYLIFDCSELMKHKQYMYCILNLCQACETYFSLYIRAKLVYDSFQKKIFDSLEQLNRTLDDLQDNLSGLSYLRLRNFLINHLLNGPEINTLDDIQHHLDLLSNREFTNTPPRNNLNAIEPDDLKRLFLLLYDFDIHVIRNKVVHASAYRPGLEVVENYYEQTREIIFGIDRHLRIDDDIHNYRPPNYYLV